jgi:uncharacterized FlaG/YvyC family protein
MLVFTDSNKLHVVYVFDSDIPDEYVIDLLDKETGETIQSIRLETCKEHAIEMAKWMTI